MQFDSIKALVQQDFDAVDNVITKNLHSKASIINDLGHYIIQGGGKRLRPLVSLLTAKACGYSGDQHIQLATVVELIHTATLLHDDVVDGAEVRRGKKTANRIWGNVAAVLVGDFLYSKSFQLLTEVAHSKIMRVMSEATNTMAEGEALQLLDRHNPATAEGAYLNVIRSKTAKLFEASAKMSAILSQQEDTIVDSLGLYGMHLGTAFQLIDDILDYIGSPLESGKQIGNDLSQGKVTLPLIYALEVGTPEEVRLIREVIKSGDESKLQDIQKIIETTGGIEYTKQFARTEVERALKALLVLPESVYRDGAYHLAQFALERNH